MASAAKAGQAARQRARQRRITLEAETKARNDRIEIWTTEVFKGVAQRDRALQAVASAEDAMADGLIGLAGEGLTTSNIAALCETTIGEIYKLTKRRRVSGTPRQPSTPGRVSGAVVAPPPAGRLAVNNRTPGGTPPSPSRQSEYGATNE